MAGAATAASNLPGASVMARVMRGENVTGVSLFLEGCLWAGIFGNVWKDVKCQCTEGFVTRRLLCCLDGGVEYDFWVA